MMMGVANAASPERKSRGLDGYPDAIAKKILIQSENEIAAARNLDEKAQRYLINKNRWPQNSIISVAFNGGSPALHKAIEEVAKEWTRYANIELDFGFNPSTGSYRAWSTRDGERAAHIRIGFSEPGYWSAVGTDSMIDDPFGPGSPSMNFGGFVQGWPNTMPHGWRAAVLHEFGHALGFRHEHQQLECNGEIRWTRGPGNTPDVYDVFMEWQGWDRHVVDVNLKPIARKELLLKSKMDIRSIMYYAMPAQVYIKGAKSPCYLAQENDRISAGDAQGAMLAYPKTATEMIALSNFNKEQMEKLIASVDKGLPKPQREAFILRIAAEQEARKPIVYIHIQRDGDMKIAELIHKKSIEGGLLSQGVENMKDKGSPTGNHPQVRYFRDVDEGYARREAAIVEAVLGRPVETIKRPQLASRAQRDMVEVWLP
ncbi:MAG: hypothetical protein ACRYGO_01370 [Janthinobacterium lividum]